MLYGVCRDVRKNGNTRWSEGFRGLGYEYNEWRNMRRFGNPIVCCSTSVSLWKDFLSSVDLGMIS